MYPNVLFFLLVLCKLSLGQCRVPSRTFLEKLGAKMCKLRCETANQCRSYYYRWDWLQCTLNTDNPSGAITPPHHPGTLESCESVHCYNFAPLFFSKTGGCICGVIGKRLNHGSSKKETTMPSRDSVIHTASIRHLVASDVYTNTIWGFQSTLKRRYNTIFHISNGRVQSTIDASIKSIERNVIILGISTESCGDTEKVKFAGSTCMFVLGTVGEGTDGFLLRIIEPRRFQKTRSIDIAKSQCITCSSRLKYKMDHIKDIAIDKNLNLYTVAHDQIMVFKATEDYRRGFKICKVTQHTFGLAFTKNGQLLAVTKLYMYSFNINGGNVNQRETQRHVHRLSLMSQPLLAFGRKKNVFYSVKSRLPFKSEHYRYQK